VTRIFSSIPGPNSVALRAREEAHLAPGAQGYALSAGIVVDHDITEHRRTSDALKTSVHLERQARLEAERANNQIDPVPFDTVFGYEDPEPFDYEVRPRRQRGDRFIE